MGRIKFLTGLLITVVIILLSITQVISQSNGNMKDRFYIGPMNFFFDERLRTSAHLNWYDSLSYNMMHNYCAHLDSFPSEWDSSGRRDGGFFEDLDNYGNYIRGVITDWNDLAGDNSLILEREKILRPSYGQRFTYQAEDVGTWVNRFPSYGYSYTDYDESHDVYDEWNDTIVRSKHCQAGIDSPGFMVKGLIENCGQTNNTKIIPDSINSSGWDRLYSDIKQPKYNSKWYIKPKMRINPDTALAHYNDTVIVVYIKNFSGNYLDSFAIKCSNFLDSNLFYDGRYLEIFYNLPIDYLSVRADSLAQGKGTQNDTLSQVDYQIKWLGKVDVWLDYVRVDDSWAHFLFTDTWEYGQTYPDNNIWEFRRRIREEVLAFTNENGLGYFWIDEVQFPNLECIGEVNRLVKEYSYNKLSLLFITDPIAFMGWSGMRNQSTWKKEHWDTCINTAYRVGALTDIMVTQWFPIYYNTVYPYNLSEPNQNLFPGTKFFNAADSYDEYTEGTDKGVQYKLNDRLFQHKYYIEKAKSLGLIYAVANQINSDEASITGQQGDWGVREPTNEEISAIMFTSLCYGSKILFEFCYPTKAQKQVAGETGYRYNMGLTSPESDSFSHKRDSNYYGQLKWNYLVELNKKLYETGIYMYPAGLENEHLEHNKTITVNPLPSSELYDCTSGCGLPYSYITDIKSIHRDPSNNFTDDSLCTNCDTETERYWEIGFFDINSNSSNPLNKSEYFLALNKRTFPEKDYAGDIRWLKIKFNSGYLPIFRNWVLKDAIKDSVLAVFKKDTTGYISAGEYQPGEGRLLKLAPVMQEGGTLVCDESISGCSFICDSTVYNNGFDITINKDVTISFSSKGEIVMEGGEFKCGLDPQMSQNRVEFKGNNENWKGISLSNCDKIEILESDFKNIAYNGNDSTSRNSAVTIINSYDFNINHCNFEMSTSSGGVNILITSFDDVEWGNSIVQHSTFTAKNGNNQNAVSVTALAEIVSPIRIENCTISADNTETITTGILLTQVIQGSIKNNDISSCLYALDLNQSSADIYENTINCGFDNSSGIIGKTGSSLFLNLNDCFYLGGFNSISQIGENNKNIEVIDSYFYLDERENTLNIGDYYSGDAYYLYGNMPTWTPNTNQTANCFKKEGNNIDIEDTVNVYCEVLDISSQIIDFKFSPFDCENSELENFIVISFPGIVNDTIYKKGGGMGGGFKNEEENTNTEISPEKLLRDSINLGFRMRNYIQMENQCKRYILAYSDSVFSIEALQKLYYATIMTDSINQKTGLLKTYYETLIQNNQSNIALIKRAFYLIQKCKVKLGQYTSALEGFQIIIQSNPYSWEGLLASWDYAATLLKSGQGGAEKNLLTTDNNETIIPNPEENLDTLINRLKTNDGYDKKVFNSENRKKIYGNIQSALNETKQKQEERIRELKEIKENNIRGINQENGSRGIKIKHLQDALEELEALHKTVKIKKPATIKELNTIIQSDIWSINKVKSTNSGDTKKSIIPKEYSLSQNYPNPFNPLTKISFALPKESKVKLIIYDMLGREVAKIINNENLSAGTYVREFNGSNLSSGVYFLRILVNDGKDFMDVKKIVLLK